MPGGLDVVRVNFTAHQVEALDVAGDGDGAAAKVRVKNALARLRVVLKEPAVEGYGLGCRVFRHLIAHEAVVGVLEYRGHLIERCPRQFDLREVRYTKTLVPYQRTAMRRQVEVVSAPHDLMIRDATQLVEVSRIRSGVPSGGSRL